MIHAIEPQIGAATGPLRPSRYWYLVAGGLLAIAAACLTIAVTGMFSWGRQIQDFQRVPVPGQGGLGPILMVPTWLIVLIGGRMPRPLCEAIAASVRYWARVKAYWYLLTDVYPAGLFGDWPGPALSAALPAFSGAGPAPGGHEPLQPGLAAGQPVPMPADYVAPPVALTASGTPGRLVLSRQGKWLVGLILAVGTAAPIALFALFFVQVAQAPPAGSAPGSAAVAAAGPPASPAPAPSSALLYRVAGLTITRLPG